MILCGLIPREKPGSTILDRRRDVQLDVAVVRSCQRAVIVVDRQRDLLSKMGGRAALKADLGLQSKSV